jgi:hypothetical protein
MSGTRVQLQTLSGGLEKCLESGNHFQTFRQCLECLNLWKFAPDTPDTDLVYAMAARIMGDDQVTMPFASYPQIVHMKTHLLPIQGKDWTQELLWEYVHGQLRINTIAQWGCVHYHNKTWCPKHEQ